MNIHKPANYSTIPENAESIRAGENGYVVILHGPSFFKTENIVYIIG